MCDAVNHTRFPKEDHVPDWVYRDKHANKGDRVEYLFPGLVITFSADLTCTVSTVKTVY
jgi:hypothetical protein